MLESDWRVALKTILIIIAWLFLLTVCHPAQVREVFPHRNKIDRIQNAKDIEKLLSEIDKERFKYFSVNETLTFKSHREEPNTGCNELARSVKAEPWVKADFDDNGLNDLLVIGESFGQSNIVVMDVGNNKFEIKMLTKGIIVQTCDVPIVKKSNGQTLIENYRLGDNKVTTIPLVFKFGGFVEQKAHSEAYKIETISFKTAGCYGTCPVFELEVEANKNAVYKPISFNEKKKGTYKTVVKQADFDELVGLLNYIDFPSLSDRYSVPWTDDQSAVLTITYDGGKVKTVIDDGLIGTFGLARVYQILFDMRGNQDWK